MYCTPLCHIPHRYVGKENNIINTPILHLSIRTRKDPPPPIKKQALLTSSKLHPLNLMQVYLEYVQGADASPSILPRASGASKTQQAVQFPTQLWTYCYTAMGWV